jgi:hypothetical protein
MIPEVDLILLTRGDGPLHREVESGLQNQRGVQLVVHRIVGQAQPNDSCRYETIARARNEGKLRGSAPWLMFVDDDVVLEPDCISSLIQELDRRPVFAALAADYLDEHRNGQISSHVAMGATLFRRAALSQIRFTWQDNRCECQCCCDDLRRLHWAIDYYSSAKARHLPKGEVREHSPAAVIECETKTAPTTNRSERPSSDYVPSVCLVVCYFGPLPGWLTQFLLSCAYNPSIDFLIFTDQVQFPEVPPNVRVKHLSISSFNALATHKVGAEIKLSHPFKVCEFKPVYGHLFEEFLNGWDYWGYTDLDVIYGDIRRFLSAEMLCNYDVFTARKEFLVGHFTLLRNNSGLRTLYQQSNDLLATLQSPDVLSFDECGQQWGRRLRGKALTAAAACDSMTHVVHRMVAQSKISACFSPLVVEWPELAYPGWRLRWDAGRLWDINQGREAMYFHFHAFKGNRRYRQPCDTGADPVFEITPDGFERPQPSRELVCLTAR